MISPEKEKVLELFGRGRELYRERRFEEARQVFEAALELIPDDGPSEVYRKRCVAFAATPPPAGWDGVYVRTEK